MRLVAAQYIAAKDALYTAKEQPCNPTADVCDRVLIQISQPSGNTDCVGLVPEKLKFAVDIRTKTMVWQIVYPSDPIRRTPSSGSTTTTSLASSLGSGHRRHHGFEPGRLKNGKVGNGNGPNKDPHFYTMKTDNNATLDAAYLPIIVHQFRLHQRTRRSSSSAASPIRGS